MNVRVLLILGGSIVFTGALIALVLWLLAAGDKDARTKAQQFAAALVDDRTAVAKGGERFVEGVRRRYEDVTSARVIDARNHRVGQGKRARTFYLADVLLQTARGPVVVEIEFNGSGFLHKDISDVYELAARDVPDHALDDEEIVALAKAIDRREGTAGDFTITPPKVKLPPVELPEFETPEPAATPDVSATLRKAQRQLRCVQRAEGDVEKLAKCAP